MKMISAVITLCLAFLCSGCGFHMQGNAQLAQPLHRLYLQTPDPYGHLSRDLQQNLKMSNVVLTATSAEADSILVILEDNSTQKLLSVGGTQQTRQYELGVTVVFEIENKNGLTMVPRQTLSATRNITVQSNQILGSSNEANLYYQQMRRQLAIALMNRLASIEVTNMLNNTHSKKITP